MTGCGENEFIDDAEEDDRINLIQKGKYYGHPNPIRAMIDNDPRQCVWRKPTDPTSASHESALSTAFPSVNGIIEYEADCFDKQLRHNLIASRYKNGLYRAILSPDGKSIIPDTIPLIPLVGAAGKSSFENYLFCFGRCLNTICRSRSSWRANATLHRRFKRNHDPEWKLD